MNLKKIIISALLVGSVANTAFAYNGQNESQDLSQYFNGFYSGGGLGVNVTTWQKEDSIINDVNYTNYPTITNTNFNSEIFLGYGDVFSRLPHLYIAGELGANYLNNKSSYTRTTTEGSEYHETDLDFAYDLTLKLGYMFTPKTMLYFLVGPSYARTNTFSKYEHDIDCYNNKTYHDDKIALKVGLGLETMLTDKWSIKAQYSYADYTSFWNDGSLIFGMFGDKAHLSTNTASISLAYHFNGL